VGATSLGNYIFSGLQTRNYAAVMIGCLAAAVLALVLDGLVRAIESGVQTRRRRPMWAALGIVLSLYGYAAITLATPLFSGRDRPVVIGAKTFTEQYILSAILSEWIEQHTDRSTTLVQSLGSMVAFDALAVGDIDVYVDYSGTLWANEMGQGNVTASRTEVLGKVERFLREERGLTLAATLGFENSYALAVRSADADRLGLSQISDLDRYAPRFAMGGDYEFFARPEWSAIRDTYNLAFRELVTMDSTLMYQAAALGQVDVISAFSSDGRVIAYNLTVLEDDRAAIPPYDAVVLASERLTRDEPAVVEALSRLDSTISAEQMRTMNLEVDEQGENPRVVARRFVAELAATVAAASR
jgi:osmoprotectant transport system permease protein